VPYFEIIATFRSKGKVTYTSDIISLLKSDTDVIQIQEKRTGKILFTREQKEGGGQC